jgi:membrane-associated phospholipid phosphatase
MLYMKICFRYYQISFFICLIIFYDLYFWLLEIINLNFNIIKKFNEYFSEEIFQRSKFKQINK